MSVLNRLLANAQPSPAQSQQPGSTDLMDTLSSVGGAGLGAVASVGNFLDLPGSSVRDLLAGKGLRGSFDQWMTPLSSENRTSGRDLLEMYGMRKNRETGMTGWLSDPGEGLRDLAGFGAEVVLDPFGPATKALMAGSAAGRALTTAAGRAHPLVRKLGGAAKYAFDTLPENITRGILTQAGKATRGVKSLFNAPSAGITDPFVMPMAEQARTMARDYREVANLHVTELANSARVNGFNLVPNESLDMNDLSNAMRDDSPLRVQARMDAERRAFEGIYNPEEGGFLPKDIVSLNGKLHQIEYLDRTPNGTKVKLVGDDVNLYDDGQLEPIYQQLRETIPEPHLNLIQQMRSVADALNNELKPYGMGDPELADPKIDWFYRRKSDQLRRVEQIGGLNMPSWARSNHQSLVRTLATNGGRDIAYRAVELGTTGLNAVFDNPKWGEIIKRIDSASVIGPGDLKIMPGYVGKSHVEEIAQALDRNPDELWEEMWQAQPISKTGTFAYSPQEGLYHVVDSGLNQKGEIDVRLADGTAELLPRITPESLADGSFDDALHFIERDLAGKGSSAVRMTVSPEVGDVLKKRGYEGVGTDGGEVWTKKLYEFEPGSDPRYSLPTHVTKDQFKSRLEEILAVERQAVAQGDKAGYQPGRGLWKSWTSLRTGPNGENVVLNLQNSDKWLNKIDATNIEQARQFGGLGNDITNYDVARAAVESGKEVYAGWKPATKGNPAQFVMVSPTQRSRVAEQAEKLLKGIDTLVDENPLTSREIIHDELHQGITRNYKDKIDQWMPSLDDRGMVKAVGQVAEDFHAETVNGWQKVFNDGGDLAGRIAEGKRLTKPQQALLRLSDDSLEGLLLPKAVKDQIADMRAKAGITQDMTIKLEDRHRALAIEAADHVEKRYSKLYESWAPKSGHDYITRAGAKLAYAKSLTEALTKMRVGRDLYPDVFGTGTNPKNVQVSLDLKSKMGMSFREALDAGFFSGAVREGEFIENLRQSWIGEGILKSTDDAKELARQVEEITAIRAPADTWKQLKDLNEMVSAMDLPELDTFKKAVSSVTTTAKSWWLSFSLSTAVRDGFSSLVNATTMGGMNPLSILSKGKAAWSFASGTPIDPGPGIVEIEQYLAARNLPSDAANRAQAFQNFYNAHHMSPSIHPNVTTADASRMAESDSVMSVLGNQPGNTTVWKELTAGLQRVKQAPGVLGKAWESVAPAGVWGTDELGRSVQRSTSGPIQSAINQFRSTVDTWNRTTYILDRLDKTKSLKDAFAASDKFLLNADPKNFTRFEHVYMKTYFPFYSFMRQTLPLFLSEMVLNPGGGLGMMVRGTRLGQGDEKGYVPYQYQDSAAIPWGKTDEGNLKYLTSLGLMHEDAVKYAGNILQADMRGLMQQAASSTNPAFKWFIEHSTNTSLFSQGPMGGRRLDDLDPTIGRILTNYGLQDAEASGRATPFLSPTLESLAAAGPASRILSMAKIASDNRTGVGEKAFRLLTGVRIENVTPEQITRDLRDRLNAIQIASGARPLTIVSGSEKLVEHLKASGQPETAAVLERINKALAAQRRAVAEDDKPTNSRTVVDMLRQAQ